MSSTKDVKVLNLSLLKEHWIYIQSINIAHLGISLMHAWNPQHVGLCASLMRGFAKCSMGIKQGYVQARWAHAMGCVAKGRCISKFKSCWLEIHLGRKKHESMRACSHGEEYLRLKLVNKCWPWKGHAPTWSIVWQWAMAKIIHQRLPSIQPQKYPIQPQITLNPHMKLV